MGRLTTILACNIYDDDQGENPCVVDKPFIAELNKKYSIEYRWQFEDDGSIEFNGLVHGEPENMVKALLETAKSYDRSISGTFSYDDDKTGGSSHGLVYIAKNYTAIIYEYDTDINITSLSMLKNPVTTKVITLDTNIPKDKYPYPGIKGKPGVSPVIPCDWKSDD